MLFVVLILFILLSISIFVNINLYTKYEKLEELSNGVSDSLNNANEFIESMKKRIMTQRSYLNQLDRRGAFEADDEIGYFFKELKKIINDVHAFLNQVIPSDDIRTNLSARFDGEIDE